MSFKTLPSTNHLAIQQHLYMYTIDDVSGTETFQYFLGKLR